MKAILLCTLAAGLAACTASSSGDDGGGDDDDGGGGGDARALAGNPALNRTIVTSRDEEIVQVDPATATHQVIYTFDRYVDVESVAVVDPVLYVGAGDNSVSAIDRSTGRLIWENPLDHYELTALADPSITARDNVVYAAGWPDFLVAYDRARGTPLWQYPAVGETDNAFEPDSVPMVIDDRIYVGSHNFGGPNYLYAFDRATGRPLWRRELESQLSGGIKLVGDVMLVPAGDFLALDLATGAVRWSFPMEPLSRGAGTPVVAGDAILVQGASDVADGRLYCLDLATGAARWTFDAGNDYAGGYTPTVVGGLVIGVHERGSSEWPSGNGFPLVVEIATGRLIWKNEDVSVETSPVFANGRLFFHGQNFRGQGDIDNNVGLFGLDATTGAFLGLDNYFRYASSITPIVIADNGVFRPGAVLP